MTPTRPNTTSPAHTPAPPGPNAPHFCPHCGSRWNPLWVECPTCSSRKSLSPKTPPAAGFASDRAAIISPLALYFSFLAISLIGLLVGRFSAGGLPLLFALTLASSVLVIIWCIHSPRAIFPPFNFSPAPYWYAAAAGLSLVTYSFASALLHALHVFFHIALGRITPIFFHSGFGWFAIILTVCIQPAIIEELAFRGIILGSLQRFLKPVEAILVSAALFMIIHLSPAACLHLLVMGVALGFLRVHSRSLYPGMLLHFCHNLLCVLLERFPS